VTGAAPLALTVAAETWPIAGTFTIARGAKTVAEVVVVTLRRAGRVGRGESVPYGRYGESVEGVVATLRALASRLPSDLSHEAVAALLPPGAARNALDCALWDLEAKTTGRPVWRLAGLAAPPGPLETAVTIAIDRPEAMAAKAAGLAAMPLLKVKVGGEGVVERLAAVRAAAPTARLIVDANESWTADLLSALMPDLVRLRVALVEQPLPAEADSALAGLTPAVPLCADESVHAADSLERLTGLYQAVNIKLDKTGGLSAALDLRAAAEAAGFSVMVGCMVATSLAMAPALLVAQGAAFVDLDGPLMLAADRPGGLTYRGAVVSPADPVFWG
jgi:L-alanine-DL-glutamate epimerase-like enolase superfamily enzyme